MELKDLKTGVHIEYRNGQKGILLKDTEYGNIIAIGNGFMRFELEGIEYDWDIIRISQPSFECNYLDFDKKGKTVWRRSEHTIQIDGKEIKLSKESYNNLKKHFEQ